VSIRLPTMSKTGLSLLCQFWLSQHAPRMPWEPSSPAAEHGNNVHALGEAVLEGRQIECSAEVEPYREPLARAINSLRAEGWTLAAEVPVAYAPATGAARALKKGGHRAYADVKAHELAGTADIVGVKPGAVLVVDTKTGRGAKQHAAVDTDQLRALAVAFASIYGADCADVALLHVEPGGYELDRGTLYSWDLEEMADALRRLAATVDPQPKPGPHCTSQWCPIRTVCPATKAALERINVTAARAFPEGLMVVDSDDKARSARIAIKLAEESVKALKSNLAAYVRRYGSIDLGDGSRYVHRECVREDVKVTREHLPILEELGIASAAEVSVTKEAIARAVGASVSSKKTKAIVDALRERGLTKTSKFDRFETEAVKPGADDEENAA
jgi:hypothetical protein